MSATIIATERENVAVPAALPSFLGIIKSEFIRLTRRWSTWLPFIILVLGPMFMVQILELHGNAVKTEIADTHQYFVYGVITNTLAVFRAFSGIYLLIVVAYIIGLEYQLGTIRILLARGVGKLTLLTAKICTAAIVALATLIVGLFFASLFFSIFLLISTGSLDGWNTMNAQLWSNTGLYIVTILINMGVTILLGVALGVLGRSLAFGLSASLVFFPGDNILTGLMALASFLTKNDFWKNSTAYFLGPNLNAMAALTLPTTPHIHGLGTEPQVQIDGAHTMWVALVYAIIFLVVSYVLMWKRDVKE